MATEPNPDEANNLQIPPFDEVCLHVTLFWTDHHA
jgi:hypothetical protein